MRWILGLYPQAWRARYGDEMEALLDEYPASWLTGADLMLGALAAHGDQVRGLLRQQHGIPPVTREQCLSIGLGVGWLMPWLIVLHDERAILVLPLIGAAFFELAFSKPSAREFLAALAGAIGLGWMLGHIAGAVACAIAAWAGWASWDSAPRTGLYVRLTIAFVMLTILVLGRPQWWPVLPTAIGIGVLGVAEGQRPASIGPRHWWGLGVAVVISAAGLSLLVYGVLKLLDGGFPLGWLVLPLGTGVGTLALGSRRRPPLGGVRHGYRGGLVALALVGAGIAALALPLLPEDHLPVRAGLLAAVGVGAGLGALALGRPLSKGPNRPGRRWAGLAIMAAALGLVMYTAAARGTTPGSSFITRRCVDGHCVPTGFLGWLSGSRAMRSRQSLMLPLAAGAVLLGAGAWSRRRLLSAWEPKDVAAYPPETHLERRPLAPPSGDPPDLHHTRLVMYEGLRRAAGRAHAAHPHETVREWFHRVYGPQALSAVVLYEEVRYGGIKDSAERAAAALRLWPAAPRRQLRSRPRPWMVRESRGPATRLAHLFAVLTVAAMSAGMMGIVPPHEGTGAFIRSYETSSRFGPSGHAVMRSESPGPPSG